MDEHDISALLALDDTSFEMAEGYIVEFTARRTDITEERPHGLSYALVFRPAGGQSIIRFDNAHAIDRPGGRFVRREKQYDHWHRSEDDKGRPYRFTTAAQLLEDFWAEVARAMREKGIG